jgi:hypothetical protein
LLLTTLLALSWNFEEPSSLNTITVLLLVFGFGTFSIRRARRTGIVISEVEWMTMFFVKIVVSFLITKYLWTLPLSPHYLRVGPNQGGLQDSNGYDLQGMMLAEEGTSASLFGLWLDFGVVRYISLIYRVFGVSVLYVSMFNALLSLVGTLFIVGIFRILDEKNLAKWQLLKLVMLLPSGAYYDATPSKEPLTFLAFYASAYFFLKLYWSRKHRRQSLIYLAGTLLLLGLVRLNVLFLFTSAMLAFLIIRAKKISIAKRFWWSLMTAVLSLVALTVSYTVVFNDTPSWENVRGTFFDLERRAEMLEYQVSMKEDSENSIKMRVANLLVPRDLKDYIVFSPIRPLVWLYLPFPLLFPDISKIVNLPTLVSTDYRQYVALTVQWFPVLSAWIMIFLTPFVMAFFLSRVNRKSDTLAFLVTLFAVTVFLISNLHVIETVRYRSLIEPLFVSFALWGYIHNKSLLYTLPIWFMFFMVIGSVYLYRSIS